MEPRSSKYTGMTDQRTGMGREQLYHILNHFLPLGFLLLTRVSTSWTCLLMRFAVFLESRLEIMSFYLQTYDKLRTYLLKAIQECSEGFGFA